MDLLPTEKGQALVKYPSLIWRPILKDASAVPVEVVCKAILSSITKLHPSGEYRWLSMVMAVSQLIRHPPQQNGMSVFEYNEHISARQESTLLCSESMLKPMRQVRQDKE